MKQAWSWTAMVLLGSAAVAAAEVDVVRKSKCPANGRGIIMVGHRYLDPNRIPGPTGDPNGSGAPWMSPPISASLVPGTPPRPAAAPLAVPNLYNTDWLLGATGDFSGDQTCDLVWTKVPSDQPTVRKVVLSITDSSGPLPIFGDPAPDEPTLAKVEAAWTLVGSGDFVGLSFGAGLAPPDGQPDLLFWRADVREFGVWASDGAGGFPVDQRYVVPVGGGGADWQPAIVANIDGTGSPEIIWSEAASGRLSFSRIVLGGGGLAPEAGGPLDPERPVDFNWTLRAADDFDGDGHDDLVFQNENSEKSVVWFMAGAARRAGNFFWPDRLAPAEIAPDPLEVWPIIGPR